MTVFAPSGFQISVVLVTSDGRFPLWVGGATIGKGEDSRNIFRGEEIDLTDLPIVESVEIELNLGLNGKLNVEIAAPFDLGMLLLESQLFTIGNAIEAQIGYPKLNMFTPWFSTMTAKPSLQISGSEGLTATLNGEGGAFGAIRSGAPTVYRNKSYADIINEIASDPSNNWLVNMPREFSGSGSALHTKRSGVSQGNLSDWNLIQVLSRGASCDAYIAPPRSEDRQAVLHIIPRSDYLTMKPRYTFVLRGRCDFVNYFPIFDFESTAEGVWLPRGSGPLRYADINPDSREEEEETNDHSEEQHIGGDASPTSGSTQVDDITTSLVSARGVSGFAGRFLATSSRDSRGQQEVSRQEGEEEAMRGGLQLTISTIGIPDLFPGDVVYIANAGIFSGNYSIEGLTHRASGGDWSMTLKLLSNALSAEAIVQGLQDQWQNFNQEQPEVTTDAGSGIGSEVLPDLTE
jgi:hypothetical protein